MKEKNLTRFFHKKFSSLISPLGAMIIGCVCLFIVTFWQEKTPHLNKAPSSNETAFSFLKALEKFTGIPNSKNPNTQEILALKERLEKDLSLFDEVSSVCLTFPQSLQEEDDVHENNSELKASLIIQAKESCKSLSQPLIASVTQYLCNSVSRLTPDNISIVDSSGNTYTPTLENSYYEDRILLEKKLSQSIHSYLERVLPKQSFLFSFFLQKETGQISPATEALVTLSKDTQTKTNRLFEKEVFKGIIHLTVDEHFSQTMNYLEYERRLERIRSHIEQILSSHGVRSMFSSHTIPFSSRSRSLTPFNIYISGSLYLLSSICILITAYYYLLRKALERTPRRKSGIIKELSIAKLVEIIRNEHPRKISLLLSYLDATKAEAVFNALPKETQEEIQKTQGSLKSKSL